MDAIGEGDSSNSENTSRRRTVEIWAEAEEVAEQRGAEDVADFIGATRWLPSFRKVEIWEDAEEKRGFEEFDVAGLEIRSEKEEKREKNLEILVFTVKYSVKKREGLNSTSNHDWEVKIGAIDVVATDQGRSLAEFQSSKWREKVAVGFLDSFDSSRKGQKIHHLGNFIGDGGAATGGGGADRELPVPNWWWWCNGFEKAAEDVDVVAIQNSNFEFSTLSWEVLYLLSEWLVCAHGLLGGVCPTVDFFDGLGLCKMLKGY